MHREIPSLDVRLGTIYEMLGTVESAADIGTDHGYLGAHLLLDGKVQRMQFLDISAPSLNKARRLIERLGFLPQSCFVVGDGADVLSYSPDAIIIAGMGGDTIAHILRMGKSKITPSRLILQANVHVVEARRALMEIGYHIDDERVVKAGKRYYVIISAVPGMQVYSEKELQIGPILLQSRSELMTEYVQFRIRVAHKALEGAKKGMNAKAKEPFEQEIALWTSLLEYQSEHEVH